MSSSEAQLDILSLESGCWVQCVVVGVVKLLATARRPRGWGDKPLRVRRRVLPSPAGPPSGISCVSRGPECTFGSLAFHADLALVGALTVRA